MNMPRIICPYCDSANISYTGRASWQDDTGTAWECDVHRCQRCSRPFDREMTLIEPPDQDEER